MKVLMFGWEFPPYHQGGLGTACEGIVQGLTKQGVQVTLVLPFPQESNIKNCTIISPNYQVIRVSSLLRAYHTAETYYRDYQNSKYKELYGRDLISEVLRFAESIGKIAQEEKFDIIHAHDWLTYQAGMKAKAISSKPLVVHMHATEFDRTGGNGVYQEVYNLEREGMHQADKVIAVSNFTKNKVIEHYAIPAEKIAVVHNGVNTQKIPVTISYKPGPTVLFLGRLTLQKGPDYFINAAKTVLEHKNNVTFIMAGSGDMEGRLIEQVAAWNLADKILFAGFLRGSDVERAYQTADLYVMPSVSEPFGITALEAMKNNVPILISKQSGVSEVVNHSLKIDFWDVNDMASKIISLLEHPELSIEMVNNATEEVNKLTWDVSAKKCIQIYNELLGGEITASW